MDATHGSSSSTNVKFFATHNQNKHQGAIITGSMPNATFKQPLL